MNRSSGEVPSHTPAASPRLRRGHPPWPPEPTTSIPPRSSPPDRRRVRAAIQPIPTGFEPAGDSRGVKHRFLSYTFPSRQPNPNHPVAPARPGVVGAAHHSHRRLPDQAAPSFAMLPRQHSGEGPSPPLGCSEVDPGRPASVTAGGFPWAASRTRRAPQSAPGSPQAPGSQVIPSCCARPWCRDACSPVVVALRAYPGRVEQPHVTLGGPDAVASA